MALLTKNNKKTILSIPFAFACLLLAASAYGVQRPSPAQSPAASRPGPAAIRNTDSLDPLRDALLAFFAPMHGDVLAAKDGLLTVAIGNGVSVKEGMRLKVLKQGGEFSDPLTGAPVEKIELPVGDALIINGPGPTGGGLSIGRPAGASGGVRMKLLDGRAEPGDIVRISASKVRLLFYQLKGVSWGLSEKYYDLLKKTGRFDLLASPLDDEKDAVAEGRRLKADAVLIISQGARGGNVLLDQKLLWTSDGSQVLAGRSVIKSGQFKKFTFADRFFAPPKGTTNSLVMFNVPYGAHFISYFHPAPDGAKKEGQLLLMASGDNIFFYSISASMLSAALDGAEIKAHSREEFLKVQPADLNGDGRDEIIIGAKRWGEIVSYIYGFEGGQF
ncbi:MAG: hypothetical protein M0Z58_06840, partial [Nitrospiraceae bacterium]|nr:hypothetical protein [Nitrospiraceae bacterium]